MPRTLRFPAARPDRRARHPDLFPDSLDDIAPAATPATARQVAPWCASSWDDGVPRPARSTPATPDGTPDRRPLRFHSAAPVTESLLVGAEAQLVGNGNSDPSPAGPGNLLPAPCADPTLPYWLALHAVEGLGSARLGVLRDRFAGPRAIFGATGEELAALEVLSPSVIRALLRGPDLAYAREQIERADAFGAAILPFSHRDYPEPLRQIASPPPLLFVRGRLPLTHRLPVAVVGTRRTTSLGRESCRRLVSTWAAQGVRIVSGLAYGIDQVAHRTTLDAGGETIAILGCGLDQISSGPPFALAEEIAAHGLLVSELPFGTPGATHTFPRRNRIISGLSLAVVVAEAGLGSGALITARDALEQNRELLACPGPPGWETYAGCHRLLREGAGLCAEAQDLFFHLGCPAPSHRVAEVFSHPIANLLRLQPMSIEDLAVRCGLPIPELQTELVRLEVEGLVHRLPGGLYTLG